MENSSGLSVEDIDHERNLTPEEMAQIKSGFGAGAIDVDRLQEVLEKKGDALSQLPENAQASDALQESHEEQLKRMCRNGL